MNIMTSVSPGRFYCRITIEGCQREEYNGIYVWSRKTGKGLKMHQEEDQLIPMGFLITDDLGAILHSTASKAFDHEIHKDNISDINWARCMPPVTSIDND